MVLESTVICIDNSEWMRNGDLRPTRLDAQRDAVNLVAGTKLHSNPENNVALMTLANREVLVTLTADMGKLLSQLHGVRAKGKIDLVSALQVAGLVLKHRQSKVHKQRIIAFVGSPIEDDEKELVRLGKKLKKNNVSVDVVSFGEDEGNKAKLAAFLDAVAKDNTSHVVNVPSGVGELSDALASSPMLEGEAGAGAFSGGGGHEFGVDANMDPELALAIRVSMEEERARQQRESERSREQQAGGQAGAAPMDTSGPDAGLAAAAARSLGGEAAAGVSESSAVAMSEEEEMALALKMSMEGVEEAHGAAGEGEGEGKEGEAAAGEGEGLPASIGSDADLMSLLLTLPGVDPNDPEVLAALTSLQGGKKDAEDKDKKQ